MRRSRDSACPDPSTGARAGFEHEDGFVRRTELLRRAKPGQPGAKHDHIVFARTLSRT
jgi:hypothetical protein